MPAAAPVMVPVVVASGAAEAERRAGPVRVRLRAAVRALRVAAETRAGYDRDAFPHWIDADGDCRDTRDEVLHDESRTATSGCDIRTGRWRSPYDGKVVTRSAELDIDHVVALAEAWDSGARRWDLDTRRRFANDLGDHRSLVAVTAATNRSKSDRDPAEWMPPRGRCAFVRHWVAVKTRWSLTVDRAERTALRRHARTCPNRRLVVRRARVGRTGPVAPQPGTDPRFGSCAEARAAGYGPYVEGRDPEYHWYRDGDGDGVVCE
ncbi:excalibur calcium-binding domain-containing protein [Nocardioides sp. TF02-7]|uniref:excalibur calcium-binding domain-containing protein n=1 Tax=Nocardioides sp. TF02-7 TaxID=2917724 RepID=UPI001F063E1C|nr:excalibur calcium-binding domain-containing protein [Nocardioides sp. TF02-7]UMG91069.1 excalibur calcium-binding domain-containing protein [Nocardioides sp. TF02-7]